MKYRNRNTQYKIKPYNDDIQHKINKIREQKLNNIT